jgi:hypothetical protein
MIAGPDVAVMAKQSNWPAAPVGTPDDFEWVNVWAAQAAEPIMSAAERTAARQPGLAAGRPELAVVAGTDVLAPATVDLTPNLDRDVLLAGDLIDIAEARDALLANPSPPPQNATSRLVWLPVRLGRTPDSVPIILGSVLGFLMVLVFATAAVFARLAR